MPPKAETLAAKDVERLGREVGEDGGEVGVAEAILNNGGKDAAVVGGDVEVLILEELPRAKARPVGDDLTTVDAITQHHHHVGVAVIGALRAVLCELAAKL